MYNCGIERRAGPVMAFLFLVRSWLGVQTESKGQTPARVCASNVCSPRSRSVSSFLPPPSRLPVAFQLFSLLAVRLIFALYWAFDQCSFTWHDPIVSIPTPGVDREKKSTRGEDELSQQTPSNIYITVSCNFPLNNMLCNCYITCYIQYNCYITVILLSGNL